ncbi:MAG: RdgB/HAM1 family non-canonical purine NTP pyrophosphatase [Clostridiales bacterium]|nr:RdgB/HAM1 family non-canonical purine NTP pyrophosphatase [Clostridiales bacterium]
MTHKLVVATGNAHKLEEIRAILQGWEIISQRDAGFLGDVEETGDTFLENARLKAWAACKATGLPTLADDSGLCVDALGGAPGVHSARYSGGGDAENRALLLKNLQGAENRRASFACVIVVAFPSGKEIVCEGRTYGSILHEERGEHGFGYDSLFLSDDLKKSFAEASAEEKNGVSHRGRALKQLKEKL